MQFCPESLTSVQKRTLDLEIQFHWFDQRHQPIQKFLVHWVQAVGIETDLVGKLHHSAKCISLPSWRNVPSDICFEQAWNLPLKVLNLCGSAIDLFFSHARFPAESKAMDVHTGILNV
jgi:hypothetical protein